MHRAARQPLFWLVILAASAVAGLVYDRIIGGGEPIVAAVRGILMAASKADGSSRAGSNMSGACRRSSPFRLPRPPTSC